jgi:hypothetical protein
MAEFRAGNFADAETAFKRAEEATELDDWQPGNRRFVQGPARFFRSVILFLKGKKAEAEKLFRQAESEMKPLPTDESQFWSEEFIHDSLIHWLVHKEAKALLQLPE